MAIGNMATPNMAITIMAMTDTGIRRTNGVSPPIRCSYHGHNHGIIVIIGHNHGIIVIMAITMA